MNTFSITLLVVGVCFLVVLQRRFDKVSKEERDDSLSWILSWELWACGFIVVLGLVGVFDFYVYKLPNPFDGSAVERDEKTSSEEGGLLVSPIEKPNSMRDAKGGQQ